MDEMNRKDPLSNEENVPEEILEAAQQTDPVEEQTDSLDLTEPSEGSDEAVSQEEETSTHELTEEGQEADELEEENEPEEEIDAEEEERYLLRLARHRRIRKISLIAVAGAIVVVLLAWLIVWRVTTVDPHATAITVGGEKICIFLNTPPVFYFC